MPAPPIYTPPTVASPGDFREYAPGAPVPQYVPPIDQSLDPAVSRHSAAKSNSIPAITWVVLGALVFVALVAAGMAVLYKTTNDDLTKSKALVAEQRETIAALQGKVSALEQDRDAATAAAKEGLTCMKTLTSAVSGLSDDSLGGSLAALSVLSGGQQQCVDAINGIQALDSTGSDFA